METYKKPLILVTNDDSIHAKGLKVLISIAEKYGDVIVMAGERNVSAQSHALTIIEPLRVTTIAQKEGLSIYATNGTPVDCVKLAEGNFCTQKPDLVISGINHGSNASINVIYSGTMGAVIEACINGINAIGFSLLNHSSDADFSACEPYIDKIISKVLHEGLPKDTCLNVNIPNVPISEIKGIKICRQSKANWSDSYEQRVSPVGMKYWWLTGNFNCEDKGEDTDMWALEHNYVSIVPLQFDYTNYSSLSILKKSYELD